MPNVCNSHDIEDEYHYIYLKIVFCTKSHAIINYFSRFGIHIVRTTLFYNKIALAAFQIK